MLEPARRATVQCGTIQHVVIQPFNNNELKVARLLRAGSCLRQPRPGAAAADISGKVTWPLFQIEHYRLRRVAAAVACQTCVARAKHVST